jgi:hypothetical protein
LVFDVTRHSLWCRNWRFICYLVEVYAPVCCLILIFFTSFAHFYILIRPTGFMFYYLFYVCVHVLYVLLSILCVLCFCIVLYIVYSCFISYLCSSLRTTAIEWEHSRS